VTTQLQLINIIIIGNDCVKYLIISAARLDQLSPNKHAQ